MTNEITASIKRATWEKPSIEGIKAGLNDVEDGSFTGTDGATGTSSSLS